MATMEEFEVLRDLSSSISAIFARVLEDDDEEGQKDSARVTEIHSKLLNFDINFKFIDYENVANEFVRILNKYKDRPDSKEFAEDGAEEDRELGR